MALIYYLTIDGINGGSVSDRHTGAFDIADYNFDVSAIIDAVTGSGGGSSKPTFSPLTVDLDLNSGLTALLKDIATGQHIPSVELIGVRIDGKTVYDLRLGDVVLTTYHDTNSGHDMLSFSYQQVSLTTTPQKADGSLGTPVTFSWDLATAKEGTNIPAPVVPEGSSTASKASTYYLTIDGINGGSVSDRHPGAFDVADYDFDVSAITDIVTGGGGGGGTSKPTFSPLTVDLDLNIGLTALLKDIVTGQHISSIELIGVRTDGKTVYDLRLGDVVLTTYHDTNSGHDMLSFSYQQVSLTTTPQKADGSLGTPVTFSWDLATAKEGTNIPDPVVPEGSSTASKASTYYLTIDGINGGSVSDRHTGAFDIADYNFDVSAIIDAVTGSGGGSSKPTFSPLTVDLDLNSGLTALLKDIATGQHIPSVELIGVRIDGKTVYDLRLGDVVLTTYHDTNSGHDMLSFSYQQVSLTTTPQKADGSLGTPVTFSWDLAAAKEGPNIPAPVVPEGSPAASKASIYYLTIDGINGGSVSDRHPGAFDVADYNFDVSAIIDAVTGGGGGTSKPTFSPLTVDLDLNIGLTALLKDIVTGQHISSIELIGVRTDGKTVYDLRLGDVVLTTYHDTNSGHDMLSFSYQQVSLTTTPQKADGSLGTPVTFSWDLAAAKEGPNIPAPVVPEGSSTASKASIYYLTIDGINGGSVSDRHPGAFDVADYDFDVSAITDIVTGGGGGGGTSKPTFSPLTVDLDLNIGLTALLKDIVTGQHISSIELIGVRTDGKTVYDLRLGDVVLTTYHDTNSGHDMLSFSYQQVSLTTTPQKADGSLGTPVTFSWDLAAAKEGPNIPAPVVPEGSSTASKASIYYLTIDGINGGSVSDRHPGAFDVADYDFDVSAITDIVTGGGGGGGTSKPTFSPLTVDLDLNIGLTALLKDIVTGQHISSIELIGVRTDGKTVYDLRLGDVVLTTYHDTNSGHDMLSFSYQQVSLTTTPQKADGSLGTPVTFSWDLATAKEGTNIPAPVVNHAPVAVDDAVAATTGIGGAAIGNVLVNDSDPDGNALTVIPLNETGKYGDLILSADGSFHYTVTNLVGPTGTHLHDVFTYTETDGFGDAASANLDFTLNRAPDVLDNIAGVKIGAVSTGNVLNNDADSDGDELVIAAISGGSLGGEIAGTYGTLVLNRDGSYTYTAMHGGTGQAALQDVFHFTESDELGGLVQSELTFSIVSNGQSYFAGIPGQTLASGNGKAILDGALGNQHLNGGNGADVLIGGPGDVLTGGNGGDVFVFSGNFGHSEITDFKNPDIIELPKSTFGSVADILAHFAVNDGHGNTIVTDPHDSANVITIDHVGVNQLHASDFLLV